LTTYPLPNYRFQVALGPSDPYRPPSVPAGPKVVLVGAFSDVTGLSGELEVLAHPEGGQNAFVHQLPVRHTWGRLTLKKGVVLDRVLWDWFDKGLTGSLGARRDGSVTLLSPGGEATITWEFRAGLAAKWTGPDLTAREGAVAIETLEVVHQGIRQVLAGAG
jgi:phage tail-like protein